MLAQQTLSDRVDVSTSVLPVYWPIGGYHVYHKYDYDDLVLSN